MTIALTKENFSEEVLKSNIPVLVDFWAPWCGPCQRLAPILEELSKDVENKAKICKLNVDEEPELANYFQVSSIPTMIIFKDQVIKNIVVGLRSKDDLKAALGLDQYA